MSTLDRQIRAAQSRLMFNVLLEQTARALVVAAIAWSAVWLVERSFGLGLPLWPSVIGAAGLAFIVTLIGVLLNRVDSLRAAVAIDEAASLRERLSSALVCRGSTEPFALAAIADAERIASGIHVPTHLPLRSPSQLPLAGALLATAVLLGFFLPPLNLFAGERREARDTEEVKAAVKVEQQNIDAALKVQMNKLQELAKENAALKNELAGLDPNDIPREPEAVKTPEDVRREAVKKVDAISEKLEQQKEAQAQLASLEAFKKQLARLQPQTGDDAAAKLSQALAAGDMQDARQALEQMKKQLAEAAQKSDPETKAQAAALQKKLENLSKQLQQLGDRSSLEKELEHKTNLSKDDAKKLLDKVAKMDPQQMQQALEQALQNSGMKQEDIQKMAQKLAAQQQACMQCQGLGQALAQAAQSMGKSGQQGSGQGQQMSQGSEAGASALANAANQLSAMEMAEQLANSLEGQLAELQEMRDQICEGGFCNKPGEGEQPGTGRGYGRGFGARDSQAAAHGYKATKADTKLNGGEIIGQILFDGPQLRGEATAAVRDAVAAAIRDGADAVDREDVPRQYDKAMRAYFEGLAGIAPPPAKSDKPADGAADEKDK